MNIKNIIVISTLAILSSSCSKEETEIEVVNPQSLEDCMPIKNSNKFEKCKLEAGIFRRKQSLGSPYF